MVKLNIRKNWNVEPNFNLYENLLLTRQGMVG